MRASLRPALTICLCTALGGVAPAVADTSAWEILDALRAALEATPQRASFVQEFRPAGFSTGDRESGSLSLRLPECVRWDYDEPNRKCFLLCGTTIHTWVPGDAAGRRFELADSSEPGVDLLRLQLVELRQRYLASLVSVSEQIAVVLLEPRDDDHPIAEARLTVDREHQRLVELSYEDREGNWTRFEIADYRPEDEATMSPPSDVEWLEQ